jgi:glucokinase
MVAAAPQSYWLGFDLGGTKMHAVLFDRRMQPVARRRKKTRGYEGAEAGVERLASTVEKLLEEAKLTAGDVAGIGVGVPGPVDMDSGTILDAPNLGWTQIPLQELLEQRFGCRVAVCNDVDAGVFGEFQFGAARGARTALGVFPGTGIGGGLVYEGRIFRGRSSTCLEIGHLPVVPDGALCGCGRRGCLETVASRLAMSAEIAKAAYRGQAPHLLRVAGTDLANIRSGILSDAIAAGDKIVEQIVRTGARHLGMAIAGCVNLLSPDCIVLGGGLVESLPKVYLEEVAHELKHRVMPAFGKSFALKTAELGDDAGVLGAAAWARQSLSSSLTQLAELASVE